MIIVFIVYLIKICVSKAAKVNCSWHLNARIFVKSTTHVPISKHYFLPKSIYYRKLLKIKKTIIKPHILSFKNYLTITASEECDIRPLESLVAANLAFVFQNEAFVVHFLIIGNFIKNRQKTQPF